MSDQEIKEVEEQPNPAIEEEARRTGWVPKEEFRGDATLWRPADKWVERGRELMPILKANNKRLEGQVTELEQRIKAQAETVERMLKVQTKYATDQHESRRAELEEQRRAAVDGNDLQAYDRLTKQIETLPKPEKIEIPPAPVSEPEGFTRWKSEGGNEWFGNDQELTEYAIYVGDQMVKNKDPLAIPGREYEMAQAVKQKIMGLFPHKFKNPNQTRMDLDEPGTRGGDQPPTNGKGWNDLPADAKAHCQKLMNQIPGYTKEKYLKDYFEGE